MGPDCWRCSAICCSSTSRYSSCTKAARLRQSTKTTCLACLNLGSNRLALSPYLAESAAVPLVLSTVAW